MTTTTTTITQDVLYRVFFAGVYFDNLHSVACDVYSNRRPSNYIALRTTTYSTVHTVEKRPEDRGQVGGKGKRPVDATAEGGRQPRMI